MVRRLLQLSMVGLLASTLGAVGCSGSDGAQGAKGDPGSKGDKGDQGDPGTGDQSVSAITPTLAYLGRTIDVVISGNGTKWDKNTKVDFGDKIKVNEIIAASATALHVNITVADDAKTSYRDVIVDDGTTKNTYAGAFELSSPLKLDVTGTQAQGSIIVGHARQLDFTTPFDSTNDGNFFGPTYLNFNVAASAGLSAQISSVGDYTADFVLLSDVDAAAGPSDITLESGPKGDVINSPDPGALKIEARTPTAIAPGTPSKVTVANPFESFLFKYTPAATAYVESVVESTDANASPKAAHLGKSGKFATDFIGFGAASQFVVSNTDPHYFIYWDNTGTSKYDATVTVTEWPGNLIADTEPNDTKATAVAGGNITLFSQGGSLSTGTDTDWYKVTVTPADFAAGNTKIKVTFFGGADFADVQADILLSNGNTSLIGGATEIGSGFGPGEIISDDVPAAGDYFIKVENGTSLGWDPGFTKYDFVARTSK